MSKADKRPLQVVHYTRVSTAEQAEQGQSLPAQLGALRRYSKERGHQVVAEFEEPGASGRDANRPVFKQMLERILSPRRDVDAILVFQSSRFMRDVMESRVLKSKLKKHGVRVISISQETSDDATGTFVEGFFELVDQYESDINGTRTRAALRENARRGWFNGSSPPYGFQVTKVQDGARKRGKLVPCPEERETLLEVFRLYCAGSGAKLVAQTLNERGLHYRKERNWSRDLVLKVIEEKAVIGTYLYGKKQDDPIPVAVEAIVPVELFNLAAKVRSDRDPKRYPGKQSSTRTLLSRLAACSSCGRTYVLESSGKRSKDGRFPYRYMNCRGFTREGRDTCKGFRVPVETLNRAVLEHLAINLFTEDRCRVLIDEVVVHGKTLRRSYDAKRKAINRQLGTAEKKLERWYDAFESGEEAQDLGTDRLRELKALKDRLEIELRSMAAPPKLRIDDLSSEVVGKFRERLREVFLTEDRELARRYLRELVQRIEIGREGVQVIAKPGSAVLMMAAETKNAAKRLTASSEVLTHDGAWLRNQVDRPRESADERCGFNASLAARGA